MQKFIYEYPMKVYFGNGILKEAFEDQKDRMGEKIMITYGKGSVIKNGILNEAKEVLENAGKKVVEFGGIPSNPTYDKVQEGAKLARDEKVDFILALGGGSVIDASKVISCQALLDKDIFDMEYEEHKFPKKGFQWVLS